MTHLQWHDPDGVEALFGALEQRILLLDGAMGTMIQNEHLDEAAFRGRTIHRSRR